MRVFMVRWPAPDKMSLVLAEDEQQLLLAVGCSGDAASTTFEEYQGGPLCLTFKSTRSAAKETSVLPVPERPETQEECLTDLRRLFSSQLFSDVALKVEGKMIPAHKAILAQRCKYFHAMFTSSMVEAQQQVINIEGFGYEVMYGLVKFLYTGVLDIPPPYSRSGNGRNSPDDLLTYNKEVKFPFIEQVLQAADFYGLSSLVQLCVVEAVNMAEADHNNLTLATKLFSLGLRLNISVIKDRAAFITAQIVSSKVYAGENVDEVYGELCHELKAHIRLVWEERLHQPPILVGKTKELDTYLNECRGHFDYDAVQTLIQSGAKPQECFALHSLIRNCYVDDIQKESNFAIVSKLVDLFLKEGCGIDQLDADGLSPLHLAALRDTDKLVRKLIDSGASLLVKCRCHRLTPAQKVRRCFDEKTSNWLILRGYGEQEDMDDSVTVQYAGMTQMCSLLESAGEGTSTEGVSTSLPCASNSEDKTNLNEYFIDALFSHNELNPDARVEFAYHSMGSTRFEFEQTVQEFLYPRFSQQLGTLSRKGQSNGAAVESREAKQLLRSCLERDIEDARLCVGSGAKLLSLQRMQDEGRFTHLPHNSWIHHYQAPSQL